MKRKKQSISPLLLVILGIVVIALGAIIGLKYTSTKKDSSAFRLSVNTWVGYGPFYLAQEKGYFKDEGITVDISTMEDTAQRKIAMQKGDVDGLGDTVDLVVLSRDENVPSVTVLQVDESNGADGLVTTNNITKIQDLKGTQIAAQKNFVGESFLYYLLKKNGMSPNDVQVVDMESGAAGAAFAAGQVNSAVTFEPWLSKAKELKDGKVLISSADEPGVIVDTLSINETYLKDNPDKVKKVMRAWFKALDYWKANPEEANSIMAKHYNLSTAEFADYITGVKWPNYSENVTYFGTTENPGKYFEVANTFNEVFKDLGSIKGSVNISDSVDSKILTDLYK